MTAMEFLGNAIVISIVIIVWLLLIFFIIRSSRRKAAMETLTDMPRDNISLYFNEYFPTIIKNFDLVTKPHFEDWSASVDKRLMTVGEHISIVDTNRKKVDRRVKKLESRVEKLEG